MDDSTMIGLCGNLRRYDSGITLFEVVITVMVVAILGLIGTIALQDVLAGFRARNAARTLMTNLHMARMKAISHNTYYSVQLDPTGTFQIQRLDGGWTPEGPLMTLPTGVSFRQSGGDPFTFHNPSDRAIFGPTGAAVKTDNSIHNGSIYLTGPKSNQRYQISVAGMGGRIRMRRGWD